MKKPETAIDGMNPSSWGRPVWIVYGHECFPQMLCAKLTVSGGLNIWGYSVWKRQPGFRTLGVPFGPWAGAQPMCFVFGEQQHALDFLQKITAPRVTV